MSSQPPSPLPPPKDPPRLICGEKFRAMLTCVEQAAAVAPCTRLVNEFLACERAVFRAALDASPTDQPAGSAASAQRRPEPGASSSPLPQHEPPHAPETQPSQLEPVHPLDHAFVLAVRRALAKQADACTKLASAAAAPDAPTRVAAFGRRVLDDMTLSLRLVGARLVSETRDLAARLRDTPPPPPPPPST